MMSTSQPRLQWSILQEGNLPLRPDRRAIPGAHICTVVLIWPEGRPPARDNALVIDPCFNVRGWEAAVGRLADLGAAPTDIGFYFECHPHGDHRLLIPGQDPLASGRCSDELTWERLDDPASHLPAIEIVSCPGHHARMRCLRFSDQEGEVWIASDAVLDREWLVAWEYYWPNQYSMPDVIETWKSVARIVAAADVIVPGHGAPIRVDAELLHELVERFPLAEYAAECPDVLATLRSCLRQLGRS